MTCLLLDYLNQCWLVITGVLWHSPESNFARSAHKLNPYMFGDYTLKITTTSPRGQRVKCRYSTYLCVSSIGHKIKIQCNLVNSILNLYVLSSFFIISEFSATDMCIVYTLNHWISGLTCTQYTCHVLPCICYCYLFKHVLHDKFYQHTCDISYYIMEKFICPCFNYEADLLARSCNIKKCCTRLTYQGRDN